MNNIKTYIFNNNFLSTIIHFIFKPWFKYRQKESLKNRNQQLKKNGLTILAEIDMIFSSIGEIYWLECGTLLGAYRDHGFIKGDFDIDIGTYFTNHEKIQDVLIRNGFKLKKEFICPDGLQFGFEQTFEKNGISIDFFYYQKRDNELFCYTFKRFDGDNTIGSKHQVGIVSVPYSGFSKINFRGISVIVPKDIDAHLKSHYGKNFMIPDPLFNYITDAPNLIWLDETERVAYLKEYPI